MIDSKKGGRKRREVMVENEKKLGYIELFYTGVVVVVIGGVGGGQHWGQ